MVRYSYMSRWMLVLIRRLARNGLSESTLCATATVSTFLLSLAWACCGAGLSGVARPAVRESAAAPAAAMSRSPLLCFSSLFISR